MWVKNAQEFSPLHTFVAPHRRPHRNVMTFVAHQRVMMMEPVFRFLKNIPNLIIVCHILIILSHTAYSKNYSFPFSQKKKKTNSGFVTNFYIPLARLHCRCHDNHYHFTNRHIRESLGDSKFPN